MSWLGRILGTEKAIDAGINAVDKMILTDEEKAQLKIEVWNAAHPFKTAQRFFMLLVTIPYMLAWSVNVALTLKGVESQLMQGVLSGRVGDVFLAMAIFYFGGGTLNTMINFKGKS